MKKVVCLFLTMVMCISLVACGGEKSSEENVTNDTLTNNTDAPQDASTDKAVEPEINGDNGKEVEKTIDAVAEALGLTNGEKNFYDKIGAIDGKEYNGGMVELYQYDEASEKYQQILNGNGSSRVAAYKNGIVLLFPVGSKKDADLIKAFNELKIKD